MNLYMVQTALTGTASNKLGCGTTHGTLHVPPVNTINLKPNII